LDGFSPSASAGDLAAQGFAAELTDAFEVIPVVTGGELIISRLVFTRFVLITAHARKIDASRHMMANKPVYPGLFRRTWVVVSYICMILTP
jgi:hypothetical protein